MDKNTIKRIERNDCTGCGLCVAKCPQNCIVMKEDYEGFRYPQIDETKCVNCGLCLRFCPTTDVSDLLYSKEKCSYYCGIIKDSQMLLKSSSGGVFGTLAQYIIAEGGYVCGCVYNENMEAIHILTDQQQDIEKMYGSKYVQSRVEHCFVAIKSHLSKDDTVMYTGTACQIAALRLYLGKEYPNLYCVEILCHGVPSPGFFREYKGYLENKLSGKVRDIRFRDKRKDGWGSEHRTCVIYEKNGKLREYRPTLPAYFSAFFYGLNLRESCYQCKYATAERIADLTIGDFWGSWYKYGKRFHEGISVVSVNSQKGRDLTEVVRDRCHFFEELTQEEAMLSNDNFEHPVKRPVERTDFYIGQKTYRGVWKKAYLTRTYRKKTLASVYGAVVPINVRIAIQSVRRKIKR